MNPQKINILVSVIDNYGDMGSALEWCDAYEQISHESTEFVFWVDRVDIFRDFLQEIFPEKKYEIHELSQFSTMNESPISIAFLHAPILSNPRFDRTILLHIGYLTFDPNWIRYCESLHIRSTPNHEIIELIQTPLLGGSGLIPRRRDMLSRDNIAKFCNIHIDRDSEWITVFAYADTIDRIDWSSFPIDATIFFLGNAPANLPKNAILQKILPNYLYYSLLTESDWSIVRGDTSLAAMLELSKKPFYADIYRDRGGYPEDFVENLSDFLHANKVYRDVHHRLNQGGAILSYSDFSLGGEYFLHPKTYGNLVESVKKHIDRFYFSL